ncbi:3',5'-cyclic adenosine monophosphate phosphodiesterase CpdA [compost metagenome]
MITEVLDRAFVLNEAMRIHERWNAGSSGGRRRGPLNQNSGIGAEVADALKAAILRELRATPNNPVTSRRRTDTAPVAKPQIEGPYISSDPIISIVQSALELYLLDPETPDGVEPDTKNPMVTDQRVARKKTTRRVFEKFSVTDVGWVSSVVAMGIRNFKNRRPFNSKPAQSMTIADKCRVVVVGDWGSGVPRAQHTAMAMRKHIVNAKDHGMQCHVVHLGDVYYSGFEYEYRDRFLPYWPVHPTESEKALSWCINGNHDMYSGGYAYYDYLLADPRFARQERSSFFRLANSHWQILGLDTAWDDNGLKDPQAAWVREQVANNPQKTMVLSHHQFFSARENSPDVGKVLREKLKDVLEANKIDAALWGHEHRCMTYEPYDHIRHARLIGHGGVPVWVDDFTEALPSPGRFQSSKFMGGGLERFAKMGYAVLDFDGPLIKAAYYDEDGVLDLEEVIQ